MSDRLREKVKRLPKEPGVYLMRGDHREVVYVGKAKNLKARVSTYFQQAGEARFRMHSLRALIRDVEVIVTDTEKEAFLLEHTLIQRHLPRFNVRLKDDKSFLSLRIDPREKWPRVRLVRSWRRDGALYFGPHSSSRAVRGTLRWIREYFGLRSCTDVVFRNRVRPCLYHQIHECSGPCVDLISAEEYRSRVLDVILFLRGSGETLLARLREEMSRESEAKRFERAAVLRDQIRAIETMFEPQKVDLSGGGDRDIHAFHREGDRIQVVVQHVRAGKLVGSRGFPFRSELDDVEFLSGFITQFYGSGRLIPVEILVPAALPEACLLQEWLSERRGGRVRLAHPRRGKKSQAVAMAAKTAAAGFRDSVRSLEERERSLESIRDTLGLRSLPRIIECYDISNLQGAAATGSLVTFEDGLPLKSRYRRFRIRQTGGPDDVGMMREVLRRRFRRSRGETDFVPRLVILDGGLGQLGAARGVLAELGVEAVETVAMAKGRHRRDGGTIRPGRGERFYTGDPPAEVRLADGSPAHRLLVHIRDEAHRFAIQYHRRLHRKQWLQSSLEDLFGLGEKRRRALFSTFRSMDRIRKATVEELRSVTGISDSLAREIRSFFEEGD